MANLNVLSAFAGAFSGVYNAAKFMMEYRLKESQIAGKTKNADEQTQLAAEEGIRAITDKYNAIAKSGVNPETKQKFGSEAEMADYLKYNITKDSGLLQSALATGKGLPAPLPAESIKKVVTPELLLARLDKGAVATGVTEIRKDVATETARKALEIGGANKGLVAVFQQGFSGQASMYQNVAEAFQGTGLSPSELHGVYLVGKHRGNRGAPGLSAEEIRLMSYVMATKDAKKQKLYQSVDKFMFGNRMKLPQSAGTKPTTNTPKVKKSLFIEPPKGWTPPKRKGR